MKINGWTIRKDLGGFLREDGHFLREDNIRETLAWLNSNRFSKSFGWERRFVDEQIALTKRLISAYDTAR